MVDAVAARPRKAAILEAAVREFSVAGYSGGRVERIAEQAGVNKQLLFHYFGSKDGLFQGALEAMLPRLDSLAPASPSPVDRARSLILAISNSLSSVPGLVGIFADSQANPSFPRQSKRRLDEWLDGALRSLAAAIRDGQKRGYFRDDVDPSQVAALGVGSAVGLSLLDAGAPAAAAAAQAMLDHCVWR
jgi:TetR/AcrR family transcriptional regulator